MISAEPNPNTTEIGKSETVASSCDLCESQFEHEVVISYVHEVNYVRGFPVEIDLEGPPNDDEENSRYVRTPEHEREEAWPQI